MHILAGLSALDAVRAIRYRELSVRFPEPMQASRLAWLPNQSHVMLPQENGQVPLPSDTRSLEDVGFPFYAVEANQKVDCWRLGALPPKSVDRPLELAVFKRKQAPYRKTSRGVALKQSLPEHSILQVDPTLGLVCPELILVQVAAKMSPIALTLLIMELCGSYSLHPLTPVGEEGCRYDIEPVASLASIRWYCEHVRTRDARQKLRQALDWAMEGAASPAEATLALALSLPAGLGGYGFKKPKLNAQINVPNRDREAVSGRHYYLDVFWQDAYVDLEYESTSFHLDPLTAERLITVREGQQTDLEATRAYRSYIRKADADRRRMRDLQYLGIQVIPVMSSDLHSVRRMDQVALALARRIESTTGLNLSSWHDNLDEHGYRWARQQLLQELQPHSTVLL